MCTKLWRIEEWAYIVFYLLFVSSRPHGMYSSNSMLGLGTFLGSFLWLPFTYFYCGLVWEVLFQNSSFHIKRTGGDSFFAGLVFCLIFLLGGLSLLMLRVFFGVALVFGVDRWLYVKPTGRAMIY